MGMAGNTSRHGAGRRAYSARPGGAVQGVTRTSHLRQVEWGLTEKECAQTTLIIQSTLGVYGACEIVAVAHSGAASTRLLTRTPPQSQSSVSGPYSRMLILVCSTKSHTIKR